MKIWQVIRGVIDRFLDRERHLTDFQVFRIWIAIVILTIFCFGTIFVIVYEIFEDKNRIIEKPKGRYG